MLISLLVDDRTRDQRLADLLLCIDTAGLPSDRREACRALVLEAVRPTLTWASPRPGVHLIDGRRIDSDLVGLTAAHLAMMSPGRKVVRAADMAAPGASQPANAVRNALRTAVLTLQPLNARAASAVRTVRVVDGFVTYSPNGRIDVIAT